MSENLTQARLAPPAGSGPGWLGQFLDGYPAPVPGIAEVAILAAPEAATPARLAALRVLAEEHMAAFGGVLRPLAAPPGAILLRTAREHAEALDAGLCLLLGESAVSRFDLPERADALAERLAEDHRPGGAGFAVALGGPARPVLRIVPALDPEALAAGLAPLETLPAAPPPLLCLPLALLRGDAFLRFAARHRRRARAGEEGLVAAVPLADLLAAPDSARRAAAALAHAGHRLGAMLPAHAWRLFDPTALPASLLVAAWDPHWHRGEPAFLRAGPKRILATGVDTASALAACRAAGIGAVAGLAATRLLSL